MLKCSVQLCSVTQSCLTLYNPMDCSTPGFPVHHQLPEFAQTHVHQVSDAIQPSHPLALHLSHHVRLFATLWTVARLAPLLWDSPGQNTGVGCHFLLQGIFLTQGSNPGLLCCRQMLYPLSHQGSPSFPPSASLH